MWGVVYHEVVICLSVRKEPPLSAALYQTRLTSVLAVTALLTPLLGGCYSEPIDPPPLPERWTLSLETADLVTVPRGGTTAPIQFRLLDSAGDPIVGNRVEFKVTPSGEAIPSAATTDGEGRVSVQMKVGSDVATYILEAVAMPYRAYEDYRAYVASVQLVPDSIELAIACQRMVLASTTDYPEPKIPYDYDERSVQFSIADPDIVEISEARYHGVPRPQHQWLKAVRPGTTTLTAAYSDAADTAQVRVLADEDLVAQRVELIADTVKIAIGEDLRGTERAHTRAYVQGDCSRNIVPDLQFADTTIAAIEPDANYGYRFVGRKFGNTKLIATAGVGADTIPALVRRLSVAPADTTIRMGEELRFRFFVGDENGWTREPVTWMHGDGTVTDGGGTRRVVTGLKPGVSTVYVMSGDWGAPATVRVVAADSTTS